MGSSLRWATGNVAQRASGPTGKGSSATFGGVQLATLCTFPLLHQQVTGLPGYMGQSSEDKFTGNPGERTVPKRSLECHLMTRVPSLEKVLSRILWENIKTEMRAPTHLPHGFDSLFEKMEVTMACQVPRTYHVTVKPPELLHLQ